MPPPKPRCTGYKLGGIRCSHPAKDGGFCGHHIKLSNEERSGRLAYTIDRLKRGYDYENRLGVIPAYGELVAMPYTELHAYYLSLHERLRPSYPGYTGEFSPNDYVEIMRYRPRTQWELAVERIPPPLRARRDQIEIMNTWYVYLAATVSHFGEIMGFDRNQACDPANEHILVAVLTESWGRIPDGTKRELWRCFRNLGLFLGQEHIRRLMDVLPAPIERANAFVADNQNVHRAETVKYVQAIFQKLVEIPVPEGQHTLAEVIRHCNLPPKAIVLLSQHYCEPVAIYEIPNAYPRALDAVWAYVTTHPEKDELCRRIRDELTDNIGMCAQGNLSRLCNILSGYIDSIPPPVMKGELIQHKMAQIAADGEGDKVGRAKAALAELGVPEEEQAPWIEALADI
jgi:hypothetical protein